MNAETGAPPSEAPKRKMTLNEMLAKGRAAENADTFQGQLLASLEERAARESTVARWESGKFGRDTFHYGDDTALIQWHNEGGTMKDYAQMLDMQKGWWRETYFEGKRGGDLDRIGLIAPTFNELLSFYATDRVEEFSLPRLLADAGKSDDSVTSQYIEGDVTVSGSTDNPGRVATEAIAKFLVGIMPSGYSAEFSNGGGDTMLALRIVPQNRDAQLAVINGGKPIEEVVDSILSNRDALVDFLRESL